MDEALEKFHEAQDFYVKKKAKYAEVVLAEMKLSGIGQDRK